MFQRGPVVPTLLYTDNAIKNYCGLAVATKRALAMFQRVYGQSQKSILSHISMHAIPSLEVLCLQNFAQVE